MASHSAKAREGRGLRSMNTWELTPLLALLCKSVAVLNIAIPENPTFSNGSYIDLNARKQNLWHNGNVCQHTNYFISYILKAKYIRMASSLTMFNYPLHESTWPVCSFCYPAISGCRPQQQQPPRFVPFFSRSPFCSSICTEKQWHDKQWPLLHLENPQHGDVCLDHFRWKRSGFPPHSCGSSSLGQQHGNMA